MSKELSIISKDLSKARPSDIEQIYKTLLKKVEDGELSAIEVKAKLIVEKDGGITLIPEFGNHFIELGLAIDLEAKFKKIKILYKEILPVKGWDYYKKISVKIGIMGCIVNGPGEMADADYGYVGTGPGKITLYKEKTVVKKNVPEENAVQELIELIQEYGDWVDPQMVEG